MLKALALTFLLVGTLSAAPQESVAVQDLRLSVEQLTRQIHSQSVEIALFQERAQALENTISNLKKEAHSSSSDKTLERRLTTLEKAHETLITDLKVLKTHINDTNTHLSKIDKQINSDIQSLKNSMQSMLALLKGESKTYTVKSGDSLGQIALDHKTDTKTLKKLNNLTSDTIFSGQKIVLP